MDRIEIQICLGSSCFARGNQSLVNIVRDFLKKEKLENKVIFKGARCFNSCKDGPVIQINGQLFYGLDEENIMDFLTKELIEHDIKS